MINYSKSGIYFSKNVDDGWREELKQLMEHVLLSWTSVFGGQVKENRISKKLQDWRNRKLSKAGGEGSIN